MSGVSRSMRQAAGDGRSGDKAVHEADVDAGGGPLRPEAGMRLPTRRHSCQSPRLRAVRRGSGRAAGTSGGHARRALTHLAGHVVVEPAGQTRVDRRRGALLACGDSPAPPTSSTSAVRSPSESASSRATARFARPPSAAAETVILRASPWRPAIACVRRRVGHGAPAQHCRPGPRGRAQTSAWTSPSEIRRSCGRRGAARRGTGKHAWWATPRARRCP